MIHQLRIYEIFEHNKAAFHARFRDHAWRLMRQYGFQILAMWETRIQERTEFAYILAWPNEHSMHQSWQNFRADQEWVTIRQATNAAHGDLVGDIQDRTLVLTNYSPGL